MRSATSANPNEPDLPCLSLDNVCQEDRYAGLRTLGQHLQRRYGRRWADPTSLLHRAFLRLVEHDQGDCVNLAHARGKLAMAMRSCLIDLIRRETRSVHIGEGSLFVARSRAEILSVHEGLAELSEIDSEQAEIVERRYFGGFQWEEVAEDMGMSVSTAKRRFRQAKSWLRKNCAN